MRGSHSSFRPRTITISLPSVGTYEDVSKLYGEVAELNPELISILVASLEISTSLFDDAESSYPHPRQYRISMAVEVPCGFCQQPY